MVCYVDCPKEQCAFNSCAYLTSEMFGTSALVVVCVGMLVSSPDPSERAWRKGLVTTDRML